MEDVEATKARTDAFLDVCDDIFLSLKGFQDLTGLEDQDLRLLVSNVVLKTLMHGKCNDAKPANGALWEYKPKEGK